MNPSQPPPQQQGSGNPAPQSKPEDPNYIYPTVNGHVRYGAPGPGPAARPPVRPSGPGFSGGAPIRAPLRPMMNGGPIRPLSRPPSMPSMRPALQQQQPPPGTPPPMSLHQRPPLAGPTQMRPQGMQPLMRPSANGIPQRPVGDLPGQMAGMSLKDGVSPQQQQQQQQSIQQMRPPSQPYAPSQRPPISNNPAFSAPPPPGTPNMNAAPASQQPPLAPSSSISGATIPQTFQPSQLSSQPPSGIGAPPGAGSPPVARRAKRVYADPAMGGGGANPAPGPYQQQPQPQNPPPGYQPAMNGQPPVRQNSYQSNPVAPNGMVPQQQQQQPVMNGVPAANAGPGVRPPYPGMQNQGYPPSQPPAAVGGQPPQYGQQQPPHPGPPPNQYQPGPQPGYPGAQAPQQPNRPKIDPDQIPSPVAVHEADQAQALVGPYSTISRALPPLSGIRFKAVDDGICNPRFVRSTLYQLPVNENLLNTSFLPFGLIVQPLADLSEDEAPVPVADPGEMGPVRCDRCKAYVNPFFQFIAGGRKFICNLCSFENTTPSHYFANLDMNGRRIDIYERPELLYGSYEFAVQKEYCSRPPTPASYLFAVDVSAGSVQSGMLATFSAALKYFLYASGSGIPEGARLGIMTFDRVVHFYNLKSTLDQPQMLVVGDLEDGFVPLQEGLFVDPQESKAQIEQLLDMLPNMFGQTQVSEPAVGAAFQMAYQAVKPFGGKLSIFITSLPTYGPGALKNREDVKLLGTDKERSLYEPQEFFWRKLGQDCATGGVCVDTYFFRRGYIDIATVGAPSALSGGDTYLYNNFNPVKDGAKFGNDLQTALSRTFGYDAILRVRVSNGLKVSEYLGNFHMQTAMDVDMGGIDSLKAIGVSLKHDGKLDEKVESSFQVALLYTTATGQRRVRIHNLSLPNTNQLSNMFRNAEMDTSINLMARYAVQSSFSSSLKTVREDISTRCVKLLASYRIHCAAASSPGQLILPEAFKLYPLYSLSLLKSRALRIGTVIPSDLRVYSMRLFNTLGVAESSLYIYPKMYNIATLMDDGITDVLEGGLMRLPAVLRVSADRMSSQGIYVAENGRHMFVWIGKDVSPEWIRDIFGVDSIHAVDVNAKSLPTLESPMNVRLRKVLDYLYNIRPRYMSLTILRQGFDGPNETRFGHLMIEDTNLDNLSYVDYLCAVHKNIQSEISNSR